MTVEKFVMVNDQKIRYLEGGDGFTLILIHGLGASADRWLSVIPYLEKNFHLIVPDLIGFGDSDKPNVNYTMEFFVQFLQNFVDAIKVGQFDIIGSSFGGQIVAEYSVVHGNNIKKMVLVSPSGINPRLTPFMKKYSMAMFSPNKQRIKEVFQMLNGSKNNVDSALVEEFITRMQQPKAKMVATSILINLRDRDISKKLSEIKCPSLVVWGDDDPVITLRYAKIFVSSIKNCDFALMKGCGHVPFVEKPREFSEIVSKFLKS